MKREKLQASLNLSDPFEKGLYDYAVEQGNMSQYIKRLIYLDKEGLLTVKAPPIKQSVAPVVKDKEVDIAIAIDIGMAEALNQL